MAGGEPETCLAVRHTMPARVSVILITLVLIAISGCQRYGEVSGTAYDVATALYSISNRKDADRLAKVKTLIAERAAAGDLSASETKWLSAIVDDARAGEWDSAARDARTMMQEQTR